MTRKTMLVVPTCRPESLKTFFQEWEGMGGWDEVCVIEDAPEATDEVGDALPTGVVHHSHAEIKDLLKDDAWIISKRDSAIRCFGFLIAHREGMDVVTLDDDCFPDSMTLSSGENLVAQYQRAMTHPRWIGSVTNYTRTRGLPYRNRGTMQSMVNVGLWTGVPDLDGLQGLLNPVSNSTPPTGSRLVPAGQYIPLCGMNLYIRHEAIPLMYFPLMGEGQPYRRFDDIWAGVIAKKCMDALGWHMSVGEPFVEHRRASDPLSNLAKEAPGIVANESFWGTVDSASIPPDITDPRAAMSIVGEHLEKSESTYIQTLGKAIRVWVRLLDPEGQKR